MRLATIHGYATSTVKHRSLEGWRLLIAVPESPDLAPQIVLDSLGAGIGQTVMISSDGSEARKFEAAAVAAIESMSVAALRSAVADVAATGPGRALCTLLVVTTLLGAVIGTAVVVNIITAGLAGVIVPGSRPGLSTSMRSSKMPPSAAVARPTGTVPSNARMLKAVGRAANDGTRCCLAKSLSGSPPPAGSLA